MKVKHKLNQAKNRPAASQRGYMLIEVLVSLVIFSLGMLGMIGLQANASKMHADARFRTDAALLTDELFAQMAVAKQSDLLSKFTSDGGGGDSYKNWLNDRVIPALGSGATATVHPEAGNVQNGTMVSVKLEWQVPGQEASFYETQNLVVASTPGK